MEGDIVKETKRHLSPARERKIKRMARLKKGLAIFVGMAMIATLAMSFI